ncbi:MAG: magnesium transporter [Gammaproteobacteria bacterium]|nr:magnesium transporter [Gammaproteobacteria bacterium]
MAQTFQDRLDEVIESFGAGTLEETRYLLESLRPQEIASVLTSTPPKMRWVLWELLDEEQENQVLQYLGEDVRARFLESMDPAQLLAAADELDTDDFADILQELPDTLSAEVLAAMDAKDRARLEAVLSYDEESAGGIMNTDTITVQPRHAVELVLRYLRLRRDLPDPLDGLIVVNKQDEYLGVLPVSRLLTADVSVTVREIMDSEATSIPVDMADTEVARIFAEQDLVSAPVIDADGRLVGRITIDDVVDVIVADAEEALLAPAGLDLDEDTFAPILVTARRRALWLGINLLTAFLASAVINVFEETIAKVVALAVLMPIVASMGGIAGTQTLTLVIRGIALGHIGRANLGYLLNREFLVACLNGLLLAGVVAAAAAAVFQDLLLGGVIAVAMVANLLVAGVAGSLLPSALRALKIDPALAGGVVLTTITDVAGFFVFLGLATLAYA